MEYAYTMDPFPQQTKQFTKLYTYYDNLRNGNLTTTKCQNCENISYPVKSVCPECLSDQFEWISLPHEGTIEAFTIQEIGIPAGYSGPLIFALVNVGPIRMYTQIVNSQIEDIEINKKVTLHVLKVPDSPFSKDRVLPTFQLI
ncbi:zinc ribbon domain-containing protein [Neobacillus niacini]|uniref:Zn-ribbon domain-containing OB-fold protein n=1 Tax=Neobacillus niacini TaxID=86668 RepID=UPI0030003E02